MSDLGTTEYPVRSLRVDGGQQNGVEVSVEPPTEHGVESVYLIYDYELRVDGQPASLAGLEEWFQHAKNARVRVTQDFRRYGHVVRAEFFG